MCAISSTTPGVFDGTNTTVDTEGRAENVNDFQFIYNIMRKRIVY